MNYKKIVAIFAMAGLLCSLFSCAQNQERDYSSSQAPQSVAEPSAAKEEQAKATPESVAEISKDEAEKNISDQTIISSSAAVQNPKDTIRKFVRTADVKFRVKNVYKTTMSIEDIIIQNGGFVTHTDLKSTIDRKHTTTISPDSLLETTYYTVANDMILRIPNHKLDATLRQVAQFIDFLDYRTINAEDVRFQILEKQLTQKRIQKYENRVEGAIDNRGKKLNESVNAEENLLNRREESDAALLENLKILDKIEYSTINLQIYQRQQIRKELIENEKDISAYEPSFFSKIGTAFKESWHLLGELILGLIEIWPILLMIVGSILLFKFYKKRIKNKNNSSNKNTN